LYRQPVNATTAQVFSDPPMNFLKVRMTGRLAMDEAYLHPMPSGLTEAITLQGSDRTMGNGGPTHWVCCKLQVTKSLAPKRLFILDHHGQLRWA
jgi:glycerol transport system ATP-binding protein